MPYIDRHGPTRRASDGRNGSSPIYPHRSTSQIDRMNGGELAIRAVPFEKLTAAGVATQLLTERHRRNLTGLATPLTVPRRTIFYREDTPSESVFMIAKGVVKSYRDLSSGKRQITAFLFPGDVFGLAENGRFVNTTQAITRAMVYRIPIDALKDLLLRDADLQFRFLCKVTHQLREAQRHTISVTRHTAAGKFAMFLKMLERDEHSRSEPSAPRALLVPMTRTDIADYLGLSPEAVSRTTSRLVRRGILAFPDRHRVRILNPVELDRLAAAV